MECALIPNETHPKEASTSRRTIQWNAWEPISTSNAPPFPQNRGKAPSQADSPQAVFEPFPLYIIPCQRAGLLELRIEPILQIGSILIGSARHPQPLRPSVLVRHGFPWI